MPFERTEYTFPDGREELSEIEVEESAGLEVDTTSKKPVEDPDAFDIEVVDDTPPEDRNRTPATPPEELTDEELENYSDKVRKRIKHFSKGFHDERRAKEAALREREELERLAQKLIDENKQLKGSVNKNQSALLEQAKRNATAELEAAKKAFKDAYEVGDTDAVVKAQEGIAEAKIKVDKLANFRLPALQEEETPVKQTVEHPTTPKVDTRALEWHKSNQWYGQDEEMTGYVLGLHNRLTKQGVDPQSDEYYENIDTNMRRRFPDKFEDQEAPKPKRQANVVAPATRSTAPKKVRLTQTQVALAKRLGLTLEQYARQVALEMKESKNG